MTSLIAVALASAVPIARDPVTRWRPYADEAATRCGVPVAWIERVIRAESGGLTTLGGRPITSRAGAMGLMQLMPATWTAMRQRLALGFDPHDPRDNIIAGSCYLRSMYDRFGYPGLFAAYNAGPGRYADHLASGRPLACGNACLSGNPGRQRNGFNRDKHTGIRIDFFLTGGAATGDNAIVNRADEQHFRDVGQRDEPAIDLPSRLWRGWARLGKAQHDGRRNGYQGRRHLQFCCDMERASRALLFVAAQQNRFLRRR